MDQIQASAAIGAGRRVLRLPSSPGAHLANSNNPCLSRSLPTGAGSIGLNRKLSSQKGFSTTRNTMMTRISVGASLMTR